MGRGKRRHSRVAARVILGLGPEADLDEVRAAHAELAHLFDPERGGEHANAARYQEVKEAYEAILAHEAFDADVSKGKIGPISKVYERPLTVAGRETVVIKRPGMPRWVRDSSPAVAAAAPKA